MSDPNNRKIPVRVYIMMSSLIPIVQPDAVYVFHM